MSDLVITPIVWGAYQANAYLLYRSGRPDALLIDPGDDYPALARAIAGSGKRLLLPFFIKKYTLYITKHCIADV